MHLIKPAIFAIACTICSLTPAQKSHPLTPAQIQTALPPLATHLLNIRYPIVQAYEIDDANGKSLLVFTEHPYRNDENNEPECDSIKAYCIDANQPQLTVKWTIADFMIRKEGEAAIWFWKNLISLTDLDHDGLVDPIVVYGTWADVGYDDARLKIITLYKGKNAIRHQNGLLDDERHTQVDAAFYTLPAAVQNQVKTIMYQILEMGYGIFPSEWEQNMLKKRTELSDVYTEP